MVKLTKQHFELIATTLSFTFKHHKNYKQYKEACEHWSRVLRQTNPEFDTERFLEACGIDTSVS